MQSTSIVHVSSIYLNIFFFSSPICSSISHCSQFLARFDSFFQHWHMKRNCYLDLRFHPSMNNEPLNVNKQLVAIPHNKHHMFDERELQARVIIWLASQEMEERNGSKGQAPTPASLSLQPQALLMHASRGFSIKRSLHNFLQKRKKRSQKSHPYCNSQ